MRLKKGSNLRCKAQDCWPTAQVMELTPDFSFATPAKATTATCRRVWASGRTTQIYGVTRPGAEGLRLHFQMGVELFADGSAYWLAGP